MRKIYSERMQHIVIKLTLLSSAVFIVALATLCVVVGVSSAAWVDRAGSWLEATAVVSFVILCLCILYCIAYLPQASQDQDKDQLLEDAIDSDHGQDLSKVMRALRTEKFEYDAVFDLEGDKLAEGTLGSCCRCNISSESWDRIVESGVLNQALVNLHNHPGYEQLSFSAQDFYVLLDSEFYRSIVVTRDYNFVMENPWWNRDDAPDSEEVKAFAQHLYGVDEDDEQNIKILNANVFWLLLFPRLYSWYVSYRTAKRFGLKYRIETIRPRNRVKRIVTGCLVGFAMIASFVANPALMGTEHDAWTGSLIISPGDVDWSKYEEIRLMGEVCCEPFDESGPNNDTYCYWLIDRPEPVILPLLREVNRQL